MLAETRVLVCMMNTIRTTFIQPMIRDIMTEYSMLILDSVPMIHIVSNPASASTGADLLWVSVIATGIIMIPTGIMRSYLIPTITALTATMLRLFTCDTGITDTFTHRFTARIL